MKRDRQAVIKQMISRDKIGTQEEIKQRLEAEGITVTQATLSRDLREIGLLKLRDEEGRLYYSLSEHVLPSLDPTVKDYVKSVSRAQFMLVLSHLAGQMKAYQQEAVLFQKIEKQRAYEEAGEQADLIQHELENLPIVQDYRQKMQDASDLIQYVTKSIEERINEELRHG